jgi:hypothetical protein
MSRFVRFDTADGAPAYVDPNTVRSIAPSRHGIDCALLVLDGGVKVHVQGQAPDAVFATLAPVGELGWRGPKEAPSSPTMPHVQSFALSMEERLSENRHRGDRPGWLAEPFSAHVDAAERHMAVLREALVEGAPADKVARVAANAATRLMMAADVYSHPLEAQAALKTP